MRKVAKIAISLPGEMLEAVEKERKARGENRSEFFRHVVEEFFRQQRERETVERYVRGYRKTPETVDEVRAAHASGAAMIAEEPWE